MKRLIACLLLLIEAVSVFSIPVFASSNTSVSTSELFLQYPYYLSNEETNKANAKADDACRAVLNSYDKSDSAVAAFFTCLKDGDTIALKDLLAGYGLMDSYYQENELKAVKAFLKEYIQNENALVNPVKKIEKAYKVVNDTFKTVDSVTKYDTYSFIKSYYDEVGIRINEKDIETVVNRIYNTKSIKETLKYAGNAIKVQNLCFEVAELQSLNYFLVDDLMKELKKSGQGQGELYSALFMLQEKMQLDYTDYVISNFCTDYALKFLADNATMLLFESFGVNGPLTAVVKATCTLLSNYVYTDAKADSIIQSTLQVAYADSIEICLLQYRSKFMSGNATNLDIQNYESLYNAWISALRSALDTCYSTCKAKDVYNLGGDCLVAKDYLVPYQTYIDRCKTLAQTDIDQGTAITSSEKNSYVNTTNKPSSNTDKAPVISITDEKVPTSLTAGENFGIRGTVHTDCGKITEVYGAIQNASGTVVQQAKYTPNSTTCDLKKTINNDLIFGKLGGGTYTYYVSATAQNGVQKTTEVLINSKFNVVTQNSAATNTLPTLAPSLPMDDRKPNITISGHTVPSQISEGGNFGIRGTIKTDCGCITEIYGAILDISGKEVQMTGLYPNAVSVDLRYAINDNLIFGVLKPGTYTYVVKATAENGSEKTTKELIRSNFSVVAVQKPTEPTEQPASRPSISETPTAPNEPKPILSLNEANRPESLRVGQNFGIRGIVSTDCGVITKIYGEISSNSSGIVQSSTYYPNKSSDNLRYSINNDLVFGKLSAGTYWYSVVATAKNGNQETTEYLLSVQFTVADEKTTDTAGAPSLNAIEKNMTVNVGKGNTLRFCSTVSVADKYEIGSLPNAATVYVYGTTTQQYESRTWAKISYNGTIGWVNYAWLS